MPAPANRLILHTLDHTGRAPSAFCPPAPRHVAGAALRWRQGALSRGGARRTRALIIRATSRSGLTREKAVKLPLVMIRPWRSAHFERRPSTMPITQRRPSGSPVRLRMKPIPPGNRHGPAGRRDCRARNRSPIDAEHRDRRHQDCLAPCAEAARANRETSIAERLADIRLINRKTVERSRPISGRIAGHQPHARGDSVQRQVASITAVTGVPPGMPRRHGRNQRAARHRVVGRFRGDDPVRLTLAEIVRAAATSGRASA